MIRKYEKYKDSGVEWIGEIPEGWECKRFKYVFKEHSGNGFPNDMQGNADGTIPFYKVSDLNGVETFVSDSNNYVTNEDINLKGWNLIPAETILTAKIGESLRKNHRKICKSECIIDNNCLGLEPTWISSKYAYYLLKTVDFDWFVNPGAVPSISMDKLRNFILPLSKTEQSAIASFLDHKTAEIDLLIARKEKLIVLYEEEKTAIINHAVTKGLDPKVMTKPSGIEWLGDIPEHWDVKRLKYVASMKSGEGITSDQIKESGDYPVYGGNGLRGYFESFTHEGDYALIGRQGALCGNINYTLGKFWASEHAIVCTLVNNYEVKWFGELLKTMNLNQYSVSAAQPGLSIENIKVLQIPTPPQSEQTAIVAYIETECSRLDTIVVKFKKQIELLKEYRTTLISEVVTGKIDVRGEVAA